jgi:ABC-type lipoprotein release transport system permease subunit
MSGLSQFLLNARIGFYLASRQLRRASLWTTGLIIFVMVLTFLNLVVVYGILVGLIQGSVDDTRTQFTSDVVVSTLSDKNYIENSPNILLLLDTIPEIEAYTPRYSEGATLEANYLTKREKDRPDIVSTSLIGIDPAKEDAVTNLSSLVIEGEFLAPGDFDKILVGSYLLRKYNPIETPGFDALENVGIGTKVRLTVGEVTREVTVKGVIDTKVGEVGRRAYMVDAQVRSFIGRNDGNVDQISILLKEGIAPATVRDELLLSGLDDRAKVQVFEDAQPQFVKDLIGTFGLLGNVFSSVGLIVSSITVFIVIFINALTRRKFIGILKGIGVTGQAIELSYVIQSIFYAIIGSSIGLVLLYGILVPLVAANPIDFPFSDGILVAPLTETFTRIGLLVIATLIAGYIPARMIVRKNTLNSILGRN